METQGTQGTKGTTPVPNSGSSDERRFANQVGQQNKNETVPGGIGAGVGTAGGGQQGINENSDDESSSMNDKSNKGGQVSEADIAP